MSLFRRLFDVARSQLSVGKASSEPYSADLSDSPGREEPFAGRSPSGRASPMGKSAAKGGVDAQYYANLELEPGADYQQIKKAYRNLLRQYHPDRHHRDPEQTALALEITKRLNEAMDHFEKKFARDKA